MAQPKKTLAGMSCSLMTAVIQKKFDHKVYTAMLQDENAGKEFDVDEVMKAAQEEGHLTMANYLDYCLATNVLAEKKKAAAKKEAEEKAKKGAEEKAKKVKKEAEEKAKKGAEENAKKAAKSDDEEEFDEEAEEESEKPVIRQVSSEILAVNDADSGGELLLDVLPRPSADSVFQEREDYYPGCAGMVLPNLAWSWTSLTKGWRTVVVTTWNDLRRSTLGLMTALDNVDTPVGEEQV